MDKIEINTKNLWKYYLKAKDSNGNDKIDAQESGYLKEADTDNNGMAAEEAYTYLFEKGNISKASIQQEIIDALVAAIMKNEFAMDDIIPKALLLKIGAAAIPAIKDGIRRATNEEAKGNLSDLLLVMRLNSNTDPKVKDDISKFLNELADEREVAKEKGEPAVAAEPAPEPEAPVSQVAEEPAPEQAPVEVPVESKPEQDEVQAKSLPSEQSESEYSSVLEENLESESKPEPERESKPAPAKENAPKDEEKTKFGYELILNSGSVPIKSSAQNIVERPQNKIGLSGELGKDYYNLGLKYAVNEKLYSFINMADQGNVSQSADPLALVPPTCPLNDPDCEYDIEGAVNNPSDLANSGGHRIAYGLGVTVAPNVNLVFGLKTVKDFASLPGLKGSTPFYGLEYERPVGDARVTVYGLVGNAANLTGDNSSGSACVEGPAGQECIQSVLPGPAVKAEETEFGGSVEYKGWIGRGRFNLTGLNGVKDRDLTLSFGKQTKWGIVGLNWNRDNGGLGFYVQHTSKPGKAQKTAAAKTGAPEMTSVAVTPKADGSVEVAFSANLNGSKLRTYQYYVVKTDGTKTKPIKDADTITFAEGVLEEGDKIVVNVKTAAGWGTTALPYEVQAKDLAIAKKEDQFQMEALPALESLEEPSTEEVNRQSEIETMAADMRADAKTAVTRGEYFELLGRVISTLKDQGKIAEVKFAEIDYVDGKDATNYIGLLTELGIINGVETWEKAGKTSKTTYSLELDRNITKEEVAITLLKLRALLANATEPGKAKKSIDDLNALIETKTEIAWQAKVMQMASAKDVAIFSDAKPGPITGKQILGKLTNVDSGIAKILKPVQ